MPPPATAGPPELDTKRSGRRASESLGPTWRGEPSAATGLVRLACRLVECTTVAQSESLTSIQMVAKADLCDHVLTCVKTYAEVVVVVGGAPGRGARGDLSE